MALSLVYGLIPFLRLPALTLGTNGAILGLFAGYYMRQNISLLKYLLGILPHGIFELTALILSAAMGLYLCSTVTNALRKKQTGCPPPGPAPLLPDSLPLGPSPALHCRPGRNLYHPDFIQFGIIDIKAHTLQPVIANQ
ncbi:MAG: stage II sporulation protein M [Oscillospiraceae bacterium]